MPARAERLHGGWHRITTECATVGLRPPSAAIEGRIVEQAGGWAYTARVKGGSSADAAAWLRMVGAIEANADGAGAVRARFSTLPDSLDIAARVGPLDTLAVEPGGLLTLTLRAAPHTIEGILKTLDTRPYDRDASLTPRQEDLLERCVGAGYYAIPRRATLRQLGKRFGVSTTSLSLTLRRAEAKIVAAYVGRKRPVQPQDRDRDPPADQVADDVRVVTAPERDG